MSPYNGYLLHLMKLSFLTGQLFGVINYAALTDHIHLDLSGYSNSASICLEISLASNTMSESLT